MQLVPNAREKFEKSLHDQKTASVYYSLCNEVEKNYKFPAARDLQIYVTRIGYNISQVLIKPQMTTKTYLGAITFLCNDILKNASLYNIMRAIKINEVGNDIKHPDSNEAIFNLDEALHQYNRMIGLLSDTLAIPEIKKCRIFRENKKKMPNIFDEKKSCKSFMLGKDKVDVKLSPDYKYDKYRKEVDIDVSFFIDSDFNESCDKKRKYKIRVDNMLTDKHLVDKESEIKQGKNFCKIKLSLKEKDLKDRLVKIKATITSFIEEKRFETKGILFFKKVEPYFLKTGQVSKSVELSQIIKNDMTDKF